MKLHPSDCNIFSISKEEEGVRIDRLLSQKFESHSRSYFQYLIESGCVRINGKKVKKREITSLGDEVEVFFLALPTSELKPQAIALDILYEDEHILAINKPCGMVVHPAPGNWSSTFVNALLYHCKDLDYQQNDVRPGIVHRLDKETSGVLLAAKSARAHQLLIEMFSKREIQKKYLAICSGLLSSQTVDAPIMRHPVKRKQMHIDYEKGKLATTHFELLAQSDTYSLVLAKPVTGRTHQIRVHLKHIHHPILGDKVYGPINKKISRHLLHAYQLELTHPITHQPLILTAPLPQDMRKEILKIAKNPLFSLPFPMD